MIGFIEGLLVLVGFLTVVAACAAGVAAWVGERGVRIDISDSGPYRDGLDTSARISGVAWEAEQAMHAAAEQAKREENAAE